jgi:hypothetical protein
MAAYGARALCVGRGWWCDQGIRCGWRQREVRRSKTTLMMVRLGVKMQRRQRNKGTPGRFKSDLI